MPLYATVASSVLVGGTEEIEASDQPFHGEVAPSQSGAWTTDAADGDALTVGDRLTARSLIGSTFAGRIVEETRVGDHPAIRPEISGRGWISGIHQHMLDPSDPRPEGYRLSDTWEAR